MWTPTTREQHSRKSLRYQTDLTDAEWVVIEPHLPPAHGTGRPRSWPMREIVNGIFHVMRAGCPWRLLPSDLPPWGTIYGWFAKFRDDGLLVAGLRYTEDEVYSEVTNFFGRGGTAVLEVKSEKLTGRGVVEFDLNDDTMTYASYTRGFKPGGSNLTYGREDIIAPIVVLPTFNDETVDAWELGIKTDFANSRVRLNTATFYYEFKNLQYQATDPELFEGGVGNLPESEIYGAELELLAFIAGGLTLDARLSWLETEISKSHLALDNVRSDEATNALLPQCNFNIFCDDHFRKPCI